MPKSKRNKVVHLTQVKKKGKDHKEDLIKQLEEYINKYQRVHIFDFDQTKSNRIMNLRTRLKGVGRIFSGKNSLVSVALKAIAEKKGTDYEEILSQLVGHRGLLFTDEECDKIVTILKKEFPEFKNKLVASASLADNK